MANYLVIIGYLVFQLNYSSQSDVLIDSILCNPSNLHVLLFYYIRYNALSVRHKYRELSHSTRVLFFCNLVLVFATLTSLCDDVN